MKINIAIAGGPCTGKSTLAAALFAELKSRGFDYDLIMEESRKLKKEFGHFRSVFERFYMWLQQEREELRSTALDGFISDMPLFHFYTHARLYARTKRDNLAVRELFRMCLDKLDERYQLIIIARDPYEFSYKNDQSRESEEKTARKKHELVRSFAEHFWPERVIFVEGTVQERVSQVVAAVEKMKKVAKK